MAPFVRRVAISREFERLLRRQVDLEFPREVLQTIKHRRETRAICPSPENRPSSQIKVDPMLGSQPNDKQIRLAAASSSRSIQPVGTDSEAKDPEQASRTTRTFQRSSTEEGVPEIPDRDWEIISIIDRKDANGLLLYKVRWAYTEHPTAVLHTSDAGDQAVVVNGEVCKVLYRSTVRPDEETGEHTSVVEWPETWLSLWQLSSALELVAAYERKHPREPSRTQPSLVLNREPWKLEPETIEDIDQQADMEAYIFEPELGKDYTSTFLKWQRERLDGPDGLQIEGSLRWLNMPLRQRLIFNDWFCVSETEESRSYDASNDTLFRAMHIYQVGDAWSPCCSHCESPDPELPFSKCVALDGVFNGACTNCVYMNRGQRCDLNHNAPRSRHISRCISVHTGIEAGIDIPPSPENNEDGSRDLQTDQALRSTPSVRWVSPSPTPPGSPELGTSDFGGVVNHKDEQGDEAGERYPESVDDADTKSMKRKRRHEGESDPATKRKRRRSRKWKKMRIVKPEPWLSDDTSGPLHPDTCRGSPFPCTHPVAGCKPPQIEDDSKYPPYVVFNNRKFSEGDAKDEEVRYILSRCGCATTEWIQRRWDIHKAEVAAEGIDSKEEFLSGFC